MNVDGVITKKGFRLIGTATKQSNGLWRCLAEVEGCLCVVEVAVQLKKEQQMAIRKYKLQGENVNDEGPHSLAELANETEWEDEDFEKLLTLEVNSELSFGEDDDEITVTRVQ